MGLSAQPKMKRPLQLQKPWWRAGDGWSQEGKGSRWHRSVHERRSFVFYLVIVPARRWSWGKFFHVCRNVFLKGVTYATLQHERRCFALSWESKHIIFSVHKSSQIHMKKYLKYTAGTVLTGYRTLGRLRLSDWSGVPTSPSPSCVTPSVGRTWMFDHPYESPPARQPRSE